MKEHDVKLEQLLKETLKEEGEKINLPPAEDVWQEIAQGLSSRILDRKRNLRRKIIAAAVILAVSAGGFSTVFPQKVTAFGKKLMQVVTSVTGDTVTINTTMREESETKSEQSAPPPTEDSSKPIRPQIVSLEEARRISPFPFRTPRYLPSGFQLKQVRIVKSEVTAIIMLEYGRDKNELSIHQENIIGEMAASDNVRAGEAKLKEIDINGNKGTMFEFNNGLVDIIFLNDGIRYQLSGYLNSDEMIKVAKSLIE